MAVVIVLAAGKLSVDVSGMNEEQQLLLSLLLFFVIRVTASFFIKMRK